MIAVGPGMTLQVRDRDKVMEPHKLVVAASGGAQDAGSPVPGLKSRPLRAARMSSAR